MAFRTPLQVCHEAGEDWGLAAPLVFQGRDEFFVIRSTFRTDFASIPRPVRWLFESAGANSEAGVLHDALWRESQRTDVTPRVDPWDADGIFRRALRQAGGTLVTRWLMWLAVRLAASVDGRFGAQGPALPLKVLQLLVLLVVGFLAVGLPTLVVVLGRVVYWVIEWIVVLPDLVMRRSTNLPWPRGPKRPRPKATPGELLLIFPIDSDDGRKLGDLLGPGDHTVITEDDLRRLDEEAAASAY